jgi:hypothetical protein
MDTVAYSRITLLISLLMSTAVWAQDPYSEELSADDEVSVKDDGFIPTVLYSEDGKPLDPCAGFDAEHNSWLDRSQAGLYRSVCGTAAWFDGFFGDSRYDEATGDTYGRLSVGGFWDERDGFDPRLRFRGRFALPALRNRGSFFIGRGDEDELIKGRGGQSDDQTPEAVRSTSDDALFAGFGFSKYDHLEKGFSFRVGAKIRLPPEPFVQGRYRYGIQLSENNLLRFRPVVYWRSEEKFGTTLGIDLDSYLNDSFMLRWGNFGDVSQDPSVEGMDWGSTLTLYQALSNRRALTYSIFVRGETEAEVKLQNYGYEMRYRKNVFRRWLFVELTGSVSKPREFIVEERELNLGVGLRFEAYIGPAPEWWMR